MDHAELVERHIEYPNIYERMHVDDPTTLVINSYPIPVWVIGAYKEDSEQPFYKIVIEAVAFWLDKFSPFFIKLFCGFFLLFLFIFIIL